MRNMCVTRMRESEMHAEACHVVACESMHRMHHVCIIVHAMQG